jgi:uncharacterized protein (DUF4415 family)
MNEKNPATHQSSTGLEAARVEAHEITPEEYEELPELTDEMLAKGTFVIGGYPVPPGPGQLIGLRVPTEVIERWKATGPDWLVRMAEHLAKLP